MKAGDDRHQSAVYQCIRGSLRERKQLEQRPQDWTDNQFIEVEKESSGVNQDQGS